MPVLNEHVDMFCNDIEGLLPCTSKCFDKIRTGDLLTIKKNPYRVLYALREEMTNKLDKILRKEIITRCASPWAAPVILVPKKSADGTLKYRFCRL